MRHASVAFLHGVAPGCLQGLRLQLVSGGPACHAHGLWSKPHDVIFARRAHIQVDTASTIVWSSLIDSPSNSDPVMMCPCVIAACHHMTHTTHGSMNQGRRCGRTACAMALVQCVWWCVSLHGGVSQPPRSLAGHMPHATVMHKYTLLITCFGA